MIEASLPPIATNAEQTLTRALASVLKEESSVWVYHKQGKIVGIVMLTDYIEPLSKAQYFLIYAAYGMQNVTPQEAKDAVLKMKQFAESRGVEGLLAYTNQLSIARWVRTLGGRAEWMLLEL